MRELDGDLRKVFFSRADTFCELDFSCSEQNTGAPNGRLQGQSRNVKRPLGKKRTKHLSADAGQKNVRNASCILKRTKQKVAHEVHALYGDDVQCVPNV